MRLSMRLWKRPRDGMYYAVFDGDRRKSLKTKEAAEAKRIYAQIRKEWLAGKLAHLTGQSKSITLEQFKGEYLTWAEKVQPRATFRANSLALSKLLYHAGASTPLDRISRKHLDLLIGFSKEKGLKTASINNYFRHLRVVFHKAVEWQYLKENPFRGVKELRVEKGPPSFLTRSDAMRFIASIRDVDLRRLVVAYLSTGRRRAELLNLRWVDVDLEGGTYLIRRAKNHLTRRYPIASMFRAVLLALPSSGERVFERFSHPDTLSHYVKRALAESGYGHLRLHDLRHTFASLQVMQGRDIKTVQELLGHTSLHATMIYAHVAEDHLREAAEINLGPVDLG